jgi:hypothetical protein
MSRSVRGVVLVVMLAMVSLRADAAIIDFTSFSMTPGADGVLHIGDVTITASPRSVPASTDPKPAVVAGVGLGLSPFESAGRLDRVFSPESSEIEGVLNLQVAGTINAVTIQPYFSVAGGPPADADQVLEVSLNLPPFLFIDNYQIINAFLPHTFTFPFPVDQLGLGLFTDFGPDPWLSPYISKHGLPEGFTWGYAVTSLDYTRADVPEPATIGLLGIALAWMHRRRSAPRS